MGKILNTRQLIKRNQSLAHERYQAYEEYRLRRERLLTDELTEASEKLAAPMSNSFDYELGHDGELWFQGQALGPILDKSIEEARLVASRYPQFTVELMRRQIERQEYDEQRRLALGSADTPDTLVVLSPIPDVVLAGVYLGAYDLDRKVTMARVYNRTPQGIRATSLSLDLSDRDGLRAVAKLFGQEIAPDQSSEEILSRRFWGHSQSIAEQPIIRAVRQAYDQALRAKFGGDWYAGRQESPVLDIKAFIERQTDIVNEHIGVMSLIKDESNPALSDRLAKEARYNFVAALDRRLQGRTDLSGDSGSILSAAGSQAKADGIEYKSSCPTVANLTTQEMTKQLGLGGNILEEDSFISRQCPLCGRKNVLTRRRGEVISGSCGCWREICSGRTHVSQRAKPIMEPALATLDKKTHKQTSHQDIIRQRYGQRAILISHIVIGGTKDEIVDRQTGEQLTQAS